MIEYRYAEGKLDRLPELAAELVHLKVNIIVTGATDSVQAAKKASETIPIVFAAVSKLSADCRRYIIRVNLLKMVAL